MKRRRGLWRHQSRLFEYFYALLSLKGKNIKCWIEILQFFGWKEDKRPYSSGQGNSRGHWISLGLDLWGEWVDLLQRDCWSSKGDRRRRNKQRLKGKRYEWIDNQLSLCTVWAFWFIPQPGEGKPERNSWKDKGFFHWFLEVLWVVFYSAEVSFL